MSDEPSVSLVVVSRDRPAELRRLLVSLRFLIYPEFEVIVVSDTDPQTLFPDIHNIERIRFVPFDLANISAARNLGIAHAQGDIIAFCDDDAVPEPTWLKHLIAPFADPEIAATGGYVRGRNGISFQWKGRSFDRFGNHSDLVLAGNTPEVFFGNAATGIKTEGTNCAFRRIVLADLGGFDENFHYYLDETDLNYRIGLAGWKTAIVPLAQVHHGFAASKLRNRNRAPKSLFEIGASKAWFCLKHANGDLQAALDSFCVAQRKRLIQFMVLGGLEPFDIPKLLAGLEHGIAAGSDRMPLKPRNLKRQPGKFQQFCNKDQPVELTALVCRLAGWRKAREIAKRTALSGVCLTVFRFSFSLIFHRMRFHPQGYWLQSGGIFGRSDRGSRLFQSTTFNGRVRQELARLSEVRPITSTKR